MEHQEYGGVIWVKERKRGKIIMLNERWEILLPTWVTREQKQILMKEKTINCNTRLRYER